jgi:hypothetical protein
VKRTSLLAVLAMVLMGCAELLPIASAPAVGEASDEAFLLVVRSPATRYASGQPTEVFAELVYQGPRNAETVYHAASPIGWQIVQLDGPARMDGAMAMPCIETEMRNGVVTRYPFQKGGSIEEGSPFDEAWFGEPSLRLPAGRWRITATLMVSLGDCGGEGHTLETSIDLVVQP